MLTHILPLCSTELDPVEALLKLSPLLPTVAFILTLCSISLRHIALVPLSTLRLHGGH
jgi:hypothetical protein